MVFLLIFGAFCLGYLIVLVSTYSSKEHFKGIISYATISLNLYLFLMTMLRDPGIDENIYLHYLKITYGSKLEQDFSLLTSPESDGLIPQGGDPEACPEG